MLEPYKFTVVVHMLMRNGDGDIVDEANSQPIVVFGKTLQEVAGRVDAMVQETLEQQDERPAPA